MHYSKQEDVTLLAGWKQEADDATGKQRQTRTEANLKKILLITPPFECKIQREMTINTQACF